MGGSIDSDVNPCDGSDVLSELNAVFNDPNSVRYKFAQSHNKFGRIMNVPGNYRALIDAYKSAGVADNRGWVAYLKRLGTGPKGPRRIFGIAQVRHKALTEGVATLTVIHEFGGYVDTDGLQLIDSPSPLTTIEEQTAGKESTSRGNQRRKAPEVTIAQTL